MLKKLSLVFFTILTIAVVRSSLFEVFHIPSGSMIPTLMVGDIVFVNKLSYGFRVPFADSLNFLFGVKPRYLVKTAKPQRGDVIVFLYPQDTSIYYIKRVIGVAGDKVQIINKKLIVNGEEVSFFEKENHFESELSDKFKHYNLSFYAADINHKTFFMALDHDNYHKLNTDEVIVPKGSLFVLGDNRDYSYDSRFWGMVPENLVLGKASRVLFSAVLPLQEFGQESFMLRLDRIGMTL